MNGPAMRSALISLMIFQYTCPWDRLIDDEFSEVELIIPALFPNEKYD